MSHAHFVGHLILFQSHMRKERNGAASAKVFEATSHKCMYTLANSPSVVVGIVRIAHSIEVELLEQFDVSQHGFLGDSFASPVLMHVAVHSLDHDGLVVVQQLPPPDLILAEANLRKQQTFDRWTLDSGVQLHT